MTAEYPAPGPATDDEVIFFEGSPAVRGFLGRIFLLGLLGLAVLAGSLWLRGHGWWVPVAGLLLAAALAVLPAWMVRCTRFRITNYRIDVEQGVLSKRIDTLELWHIDDLKFRQSLTDRILGVGDITVISDDDTTPELVLAALPHPRSLFEQLKQHVIRIKRQRGVIKLDAG